MKKVDLMAMDICEHILLVLAAILSDLNLHKEFDHLLSAIQPLLSGISDDYQQWNRDVSLMRKSHFRKITNGFFITFHSISGNHIITSD